MLSIITITKDDPDGLKRTAESIAPLLKVLPAEQIVVDSSVNKNNIELIKNILKNKPNTHYFHIQPEGIPSAFNFGLTKAKYPWIWFLNGGDSYLKLIEPEVLRNLLIGSQADLIFFEIQERQTGNIRKHPPIWQRWPPFNNWLPHPGSLIRRNLFDKYGMYDINYKHAMDFDFWLRVMSKNIVIDTISIPLSVFDETGISSTELKQVSRFVLKAIWKNKNALILSLLKEKQNLFLNLKNHLRYSFKR